MILILSELAEVFPQGLPCGKLAEHRQPKGQNLLLTIIVIYVIILLIKICVQLQATKYIYYLINLFSSVLSRLYALEILFFCFYHKINCGKCG